MVVLLPSHLHEFASTWLLCSCGCCPVLAFVFCAAGLAVSAPCAPLAARAHPALAYVPVGVYALPWLAGPVFGLQLGLQLGLARQLPGAWLASVPGNRRGLVSAAASGQANPRQAEQQPQGPRGCGWSC